jgi:hypothetical protein
VILPGNCFFLFRQRLIERWIGLDMTYAFVKHLYGDELVNTWMNNIEYAPHTDPDWDPFSVVHDVCRLFHPCGSCKI